MSYVQEMKSEVFCNATLCLTITLDVPQRQQEPLTYQHNVTYKMPESSETPLPKLPACTVQETFPAVHGSSAKHSTLPYTSPCNICREKTNKMQQLDVYY